MFRPSPPLRVWFLRRFGLETGMELLVGVYERIYLSIPNEEKEKFANSK